MSHWLFYAMPALPALALLADDVRLRLLRRGDRRAARAAELLARSADSGACLNGSCYALRSTACSDGRCRHHCRLYCHCKGNQ